MRHRVTGSKLGRTASHRRATLSALSSSLIQHKRIRTTLAKAKATQRTIEPIITRAKNAHLKEQDGENKDVHARRVIARFINQPAIVKELFDEVAPKVAERNGGYTRIVKLGQRNGDSADLAIIELVDYNEAVTRKKKQKKKTEKPAAAPPPKKEEEQQAAESPAEEVAEEVVEEKEEKDLSASEESPSKEEPETKDKTESDDDAGEGTKGGEKKTEK